MVSDAGGACVSFVQVQPFSIWQVELQPSPETVFPSSHCSPVSMIPSPQTAVRLHLPPEHFGSRVQVGEQPSYGMRFPSSHSSVPSTMPLPHTVFLQADFMAVTTHSKPGWI